MKASYDPGLEVVTDQWLKLHRNENLFIDKEWLEKLAIHAINTLNLTCYPDSGCFRLRKKLGQLYNVDPDQVYIGNGSDEILADLLHYLRPRFDQAVIPSLCYRVYPFLLERYSYKQLPLERASHDHLCIVDSPNSLTGETSAIFDIPSSFLIWDNVYGEFAHDILHSKQIGPSTVILRSFSKFYGLANLRIGYGIADAKIVHELMKRKDIFNVNGFAQEMALLVLEHKHYFDSLLPKIDQARKTLQDELKALGFVLSNSRANFVWATHPFVSAESIQKHLEKAHIVVRRFSEPGLSSHLRITVPPLDKIPQIIEVIRQCIDHS
jgi:histidinol-phosphate aminotransferase